MQTVAKRQQSGEKERNYPTKCSACGEPDIAYLEFGHGLCGDCGNAWVMFLISDEANAHLLGMTQEKLIRHWLKQHTEAPHQTTADSLLETQTILQV